MVKIFKPIVSKCVLALVTIVLIASQAVADPAQWKSQGWKTDFSRTNIDLDEVLSGGPPRDGIPPIDRPRFVQVAAETTLAPSEPVIGLTINGDARAYPLRIMTWHEIVNDKVGGEAVVITYCPLCNAALVFEASVDGGKLTFGTTGKLRNSDLIMYDRQTDSWWQQFSGRAIAGVHTGRKLTAVPARLESWAQFAKRHPRGRVLIPNNPGFRPYGRNPYVSYDTAARPFLFRGNLPKNIDPMARVVVVRDPSGAPPMIVAMELVRKAGTLKLDDTELNWTKGQATALGAAIISQGRDVGTIIARRKAGKGWRDAVYDVTFAFVAHAFHPEVEIRVR